MRKSELTNLEVTGELGLELGDEVFMVNLLVGCPDEPPLEQVPVSQDRDHGPLVGSPP